MAGNASGVGSEGLVGLVNNAGIGGGGGPIEHMDRDRAHRYLVGIDAKMSARLKGNLPDRTFARLAGRQYKLPTDVPEE